MESAPTGPAQRQIVLPLSKAIELSYKSLRLRLSRSLLVTSGIVLALAFLMSILVTDRMTNGMRQWAGEFPQSAEYKRLTEYRDSILVRQFKPADVKLHKLAEQNEKLPEGTSRIEGVKVFGDSLLQYQKDLGTPLPAPENDLLTEMTLHPAEVQTMTDWINAARELKGVREALVSPQRLQEEMKNAGVPSTPAEI